MLYEILGPNSTLAPLTPALITRRQNLGLYALRTAFKATIRKVWELKTTRNLIIKNDSSFSAFDLDTFIRPFEKHCPSSTRVFSSSSWSDSAMTIIFVFYVLDK